MNKKGMLKRKEQRNLFFGLMIIVPLIIFIIFYGTINVNSLLLSFKKYEPLENNQIGNKITFAGFDNFVTVIKMLSYGENWKMVTNSLILWAFKLCVGLPVSLIFSYYVYKKMAGSRFFRVVLFLPNVISNLIMVFLFRYLVNEVFVNVLGLVETGLLDSPKTNFATILFFNLWLGFAGQTLMFTSAMSSIDESMVEAAQVDGITPMKELFYITLPMIFSTFTTFVVLGIAEMFVDQMSLVTFYDWYSMKSYLRTVGYFLFQQAYKSDIIPTNSWLTNHDKGYLSYSELAAFGFMISMVIIPLSFGTRKVLDKIGPGD